jgi:hypothetical protein
MPVGRVIYVPHLLFALQAWYSIDREAADLLSQLALGSTARPHYS